MAGKQSSCLSGLYHINPITLSALADFPKQLEAHYTAFPPGYVHWTPESWEGVPSEALTAIEQVCHVLDIEVDGYHVLARERNYGGADAAATLAAFSKARAQTVELIAGLTPEQLNRTALFEGYGPLTVRSLVHYLCSHDQQHLAGLQWLLGKIDAARNAA